MTDQNFFLIGLLQFDKQHTDKVRGSISSRVGRGRAWQKTLLRLFDCGMNQQEALTTRTGPFLHKRLCTKEQYVKRRQWLCIVCAEQP